MDPKIIDGKKLAFEHEQKLKNILSSLEVKPKVVSILIGEDAPSALYTSIKQKKAQELKIDFKPLKFSEDADFNEVAQAIKDLNGDYAINGIMVQLPLPEVFLGSYDTKELLELINPQKDIDGLTDSSHYLPAAAKAVISILEDEGIKASDKNIVVVGKSDLVGKPVAGELIKMGGKVQIADSQTEDLSEFINQADIIVSAAGVPGLITGEMVKNGVVIIDVGTTKVDGKLKGDIDFDSVYPKASKITPVPGGVGPMTVISLMENVLEAVKKDF